MRYLFLLLLSSSSAFADERESLKQAEAIFAGGCFWCMEADFEKLDGVIEAISGYSGGHVINPNYKQVSQGDTGHYEVAKIIYDPNKISYQQLLDYYWVNIDPTDDGGQFCDRGHSYKSAIFATPQQMKFARISKQRLKKSKRIKAKNYNTNTAGTNILQGRRISSGLL